MPARTDRLARFDIKLANVDKVRAEEAFRLFAKMAEVGQVIYLTHHRHLCDIAKRVCPDVRVHQLAAPALTAA